MEFNLFRLSVSKLSNRCTEIERLCCMTYNQDPSFPPPPPPPPSGQPMPAGQPNIDAMQVIQMAWRHFARQMAPWVLAMLTFLGIMIVAIVILAAVAPKTTKVAAGGSSGYSMTEVTTFTPSGWVIAVLIYAILIIVGCIFTVNYYRNAVRVVQGESISVGDFYKVAGIGKPLGMYILYNLVVTVGLVLCIIPGIFAAIVFVFVPVAAIMNPQLGVGDIFRHSYEALKTNPVQIILTGVLLYLISLVVSITIIGILFVAPLSYLAIVILYCMATRRPFMAL